MTIAKSVARIFALLLSLTILPIDNIYSLSFSSEQALRVQPQTSTKEAQRRLQETTLMEFYRLKKIYTKEEAVALLANPKRYYVPVITDKDMPATFIDRGEAGHLLSRGKAVAGHKENLDVAIIDRPFLKAQPFADGFVLVYINPLKARQNAGEREEIIVKGVTFEGTSVVLNRALRFRQSEIYHLAAGIIVVDREYSDDPSVIAVKEMVTDPRTYTGPVLINMLTEGNDIESLRALVAIYLRGGQFSMQGRLPPKPDLDLAAPAQRASASEDDPVVKLARAFEELKNQIYAIDGANISIIDVGRILKKLSEIRASQEYQYFRGLQSELDQGGQVRHLNIIRKIISMESSLREIIDIIEKRDSWIWEQLILGARSRALQAVITIEGRLAVFNAMSPRRSVGAAIVRSSEAEQAL